MRGAAAGAAHTPHPAPWTTRATAVDTAAATAAPTSMLERPLPFSVLGSRAPASALGARMITGCLASTDGKTDGPACHRASRRGAAAGAATRTPAAGAGRRKAAALWCAVLGGAPPRRPRRPRRARTRPTRTPAARPRSSDVPLSPGTTQRRRIPEYSPSPLLSIHILTTNSDLKVAHKLRAFARSLLPLGHVEGRRQNNDGECQSGDDALG